MTEIQNPKQKNNRFKLVCNLVPKIIDSIIFLGGGFRLKGTER